MSIYHSPVLLHQCLEGLNIQPNGIYVDVTFGGGGHSKEILKQLGNDGRLIAFDQDEDAAANVPLDPRFTLVKRNFSTLKESLAQLNAIPVDGILADLGISSHQIDIPERGFSTRFEGPLDMRMDKRSSITAADVVNSYEERDLKKIFSLYGEVENSGRLARIIVEKRISAPINTITDLKNAIVSCTPKGKEFRYLAKVFQSLRIEVNQEMNALKQMLEQSTEVLKADGKLVIMSYHSLEDRMVKNFIRSGNVEGELEKDFFGNVLRPFEADNRKPIVPDENEIEMNNRARSAKLRIAHKTGDSDRRTATAEYDKKRD